MQFHSNVNISEQDYKSLHIIKNEGFPIQPRLYTASPRIAYSILVYREQTGDNYFNGK
jgi:hypothetical protein